MPDTSDPRIFFAAERTLLAWSRTAISFMGFGFLIERFGMFVKMSFGMKEELLNRGMAFWFGLAFVFCGIIVSALSSIQYLRFEKSLEVGNRPKNYWCNMGILSNLLLVVIGIVLVIFFLVRAEHPQFWLLK
jgi:putative membrane protein